MRLNIDRVEEKPPKLKPNANMDDYQLELIGEYSRIEVFIISIHYEHNRLPAENIEIKEVVGIFNDELSKIDLNEKFNCSLGEYQLSEIAESLPGILYTKYANDKIFKFSKIMNEHEMVILPYFIYSGGFEYEQ